MANCSKFQESEHEIIKKYATTLLTRCIDLEEEVRMKNERIKDINSKFETTWKYSAEIAKAADPFEGLINLCGKIAIGRSLSKFSCTQLAGLMGLVLTTFSPKLAVPILLKRIAEDMECLKSGMEVVRNDPQYMATYYLMRALQKLEEGDEFISESIEDLKLVAHEATRGLQMAPNFNGTLSCCKLKMISGVLLESSAEIDGVSCYLPLQCLPDRKKQKIRIILEEGLSTILKKARKRNWWGKLTITQLKQDQIDPYLSCFYNTYSLASGFTNPYIDSEKPPNATFFKVNTDFIAEGEEDHVKVEILMHPLIEVIMFLWKEFTKSEEYLIMRHKKTTWRIKLMEASLLSFEYHPSDRLLYKDGRYIDRLVCWPKDRVSLSVIFKRLDSGKIKDCIPAFQWMSRVSDQYLKNMSININEENSDGETLFHKISCFKESGVLPLIIDKCENINAKDKQGETILHRACKVGNPKNVKLILDHGADINSTTRKKETPLMYACRFNPTVDLIKILLRSRPNLEAIDYKAESALDILRNNKKDPKCIQLLLK